MDNFPSASDLFAPTAFMKVKNTTCFMVETTRIISCSYSLMIKTEPEYVKVNDVVYAFAKARKNKPL